jgi:hypothetical protein
MTYFARVFNNKVTDVIVADQEFVDGITEMEPANWIQSSSAGKGWNYDSTSQVFYASQPYPTWTLDKDSWTWVAPKDKPDDGKDYVWYESIENWSEPDDYIET